MNSTVFFPENGPSTPLRRVPFRLLVILGLAVFCMAGFFVHQSIKEEKRRMIAGMKAQADVLIWAFEGGSRSMREGAASRQRFIEEVAQQPGIVYLAVVDAQGIILAHSEPERIGRQLRTSGQMSDLAGITESQGLFVEDEGEQVFEVAKPFIPLMRHGHGRHGRGPRMNAPAPPPALFTPEQPVPPQPGHGPLPPADVGTLYVLVGMDLLSYEERISAYVFSTALIAFSLALAAVAGLFLLFFLQGYHASRRLLQDARSLTLQLFENLPIGLIITDTKGAVTLYNRHGADMLGFAGGGLFIQDYPPWAWQLLIHSMEKDGPILEREATLTIPGKKALPVSISASPVSGGDGARSGYLFILRDLGEVKRLQQQLRLNERLTALGNMAAGVAHEIRNPLSTIKGYATYLAGKFAAGDPAGETARMMIDEVERLNRVVSDLLSVSRAGHLNITSAALSPNIEKAVRLAEGEAVNKGVSLSYDISGLGNPALELPMDADRFVQALLNLLINAIQATESGGSVNVRAEYAAGEAGQEQVLVHITDTGEGMSEEVQSRLFTPYYTTKASGTGLGLTITHHIIEQHNGRILVFSSPGKGTTFTMLLPVIQ